MHPSSLLILTNSMASFPLDQSRVLGSTHRDRQRPPSHSSQHHCCRFKHPRVDLTLQFHTNWKCSHQGSCQRRDPPAPSPSPHRSRSHLSRQTYFYRHYHRFQRVFASLFLYLGAPVFTWLYPHTYASYFESFCLAVWIRALICLWWFKQPFC